MRHSLCLVSMLLLCIGNVFSQSVVNLGSDLYMTKYYESMDASNPPSGTWYAVDYDDSNWSSYSNSINFPEHDAFWLRRKFTVLDNPSNHSFRLQLAHDDEASVYVNGNLIHSCGGCGRYNYFDIPNSYLVQGLNVLAAYVFDSGGGAQYLECFISSTDDPTIIVDLPAEPLFLMSKSKYRLYKNVDGYSTVSLVTQMITPSGVVDGQVNWTSSNPEVASVNNGIVSAVSPGNATITATTEYNSVTYSKECVVEVCAIDPGSKVIVVNTPGTLGSLLTEDEKDNVNNLTLFGKLNGKDIQVLRYMTGRDERGNRTVGSLADLDIYNVEFISDNNSSFKVSSDYTGYVNTESLANAMFRNCATLNSIVLPKTVSKIGGEAFRECTNLEKVDIPENISVIEWYAFNNCTNLKSIVIPSSVNSIGYDAFNNCRKLENVVFAEGSKLREISSWTFGYSNIKTITIPSSVESIGDYAFYDNNNLTEVFFGQGTQLTDIRRQAFYSCDNLQRIEIPEGCIEIGNECFCNCNKLSSISLPVSLVSIGSAAFRYCRNLTDLTIPADSKLSSIDSYAFEETKLNSFYIPKGLLTIDEIFSNTSLPQTFTVHPENKFYESVGGVLFNKRDKRAVLVPTTIEGILELPDYITSVPENMLLGCSRLKGVVMHSGITSLGNNAFSRCSGLQMLMPLSPLPIAVTDSCFFGIDKRNITLIVPQGSINAYKAAKGWNGFEKIVESSDKPILLLSSNDVIVYDVNYESARKASVSATVITSSGVSDASVTWTTSDANVAKVTNGVVEYVGEGSATITASVTIGENTTTSSCSVTSIGMSAGKLVYVAQAGTLATLLTDSEKEDLTHLIVMGNLNSDDIRVLRNMAGRDEYGNLTIGSLQVLDMSKANIVYGGEGYYKTDNWWRTVGDNYFSSDVFRSCNSLKKVVLPSSLKTIGSYSFYDCANLEEVVLPDGLTNIEYEVFGDCKKLTKINIPSSVTSLSSWVFYRCIALKEIDLSTMVGVNSIPEYMFYESGLVSVYLPANITNIGNSAFRNTPLNSIEFEKDSRLATIGNEAFGSTRLESIAIPSSVTSINNYAFNDCRKLSSIKYVDNCMLSTLGEHVFDGCPIDTFFIPRRLTQMGNQNFSESLKDIVIENGNRFFEFYDGALCSKSSGSLVYVPKNQKSLYLPDYVTTLQDGVLQHHYNLQMVVLSANISSLGASPFYGCSNLKEIYSLNPTPPTARSLTNGFPTASVFISNGSRNAYVDAGWNDSRITLVENTFSNSISLTSSEQSLYNIDGGNTAKIGVKVFTDNGPVLSPVTWTSSNTSVFTVNNGDLTYVGPGTAKVTASVTLNGTVYTADCNVTSIQLTDPANSYYLTGQGNLRSLIGEDNKYNIEKLVLVGKLSDDDRNFIKEMSRERYENGQYVTGLLKYLDMSELVDTVFWSSAFNNCKSLETVILPNKLQMLESEAFAYCSNIKTFTFPATVTRLGWAALRACNGLTSVRFLGMKAPQLSDYVFGEIQSNYCIIIPAGSSGYYTDDNWKNMTNIYETDVLPMMIMKTKSAELYNIDESGVNKDQIDVYVITPSGIKTSGISWKSSNDAIVSVTADGQIQAGATEGKAIITASYTENGKTATSECTVSVADITDFKFVNVSVAGSLSSLLTEDEILDTKKLAIAGNLNSDDIRVLRHMAGRDENGNITSGSLEILNMGKARIVYGGEGYYKTDNWWRTVGDNYFGSDVFSSCNSLKKVVLPSSLKTIGSYSFYGCANLEEVVLPDGLTNIEYEVFGECKKLTKANIPSSVTSLSSRIFRGCTSLKTIDLSTMTGVNVITDNMFGESGLTTVRIPANITNISGYAFNNTPLKSVEFEDGSKLATISEGAFQSTQLQSITIPASVTGIGNYVFNNCQKLTKVYYADNSMLKSLGERVFDGCPIDTFYIPKRLVSMSYQNFSETLEQIVVDKGNKFFELHDEVLYSKAEGTLVYVPKKKTVLYIPEFVTKLNNGVLRYHYSLQTVVLPSSITDLGDSPFESDYNLKEVYCVTETPPSVRYLTSGWYNKIIIPKGSMKNYEDAGWDKNLLEERTFSNSISLAAHEQILYSVDGGNKVKIEAKVFTTNGPASNASITWTSSDTKVVTVSQDGLITFAGEGTATITASVTLDGTVYSDKCDINTKTIDNPDNYTFVFVETPGNMPNQISDEDKKTITNLVVFGSINGTDIRFIRDMAMIPYYTWNNNVDSEGSLEYLDLSNATIVAGGNNYGYAEWQDELGRGYSSGVSTQLNVIGKSMFRKSPTLKTIILPNNVTSIEACAFRDCPKLESVVLPKGLTFIDNDAFNNCPLLSDFVIPESVDSLGLNALRGFDEVYAKSSIPIKIQSGNLVSEDAIVIVPADALQTYRAADKWKEFAGQIMPDNLNIQSVVTLDVTAEDDGSGLLTAAGGDEALSIIKDLTLKGTINGYDILMIRNRMPRLHYLDLTDVKIVANPYPYYEESHTENNRLGNDAFRELKKLYRVTLPKTIDYIGDNAFYHCENLISVKMYKGVNTIGYGVFADCNNLTEVELPEGLLSIGGDAFRSCNRLESITLPNSVLSLGWSAFSNCYNLKSVVLSKNLSVIQGSTFWYCENLENVVLPSKVNHIEGYAFYHCPKLKELRLPPMIEYIGDRAFYECDNIKDVYVYIANSKDIKINQNTFSCWTSATLHIPSFSYNSYFWDTQWGQFYSKVEFSDTYDEFYTKNTLELDSKTGTIDGDPDAVLYEKGGLVVDEVEQVLDEVELKSDGTDGASLIASGEGTIKATKLTISINVQEYKWHFFCFPFDLPLDSMKYDGEYVWRQYDGEARSRRQGGWQDLAAGTKTLEKGRGYIFQGTQSNCLSFTIDNPDLTAKDESTGLFSHQSTNAEDANWNFVGNPYTSYYNIDELAYSAPITIWTGYGYEAYRPGDDDYDFAPYQAFFVQTPANTDSIGFNSEGRESYEDMTANRAARRAAKRAQVNTNRLFINLEISEKNGESYVDKTRIVFNNDKSMEYEQDCDAAKFFSELRSIELYSIDAYGVMYSINERPVDKGIVEMGITVNRGGDYYLEAVRMDTPVLLIDNQLHVTHDLSKGGYSFSAGKGESNRFTIKVTDESITKVLNSKSDAEQEEIYDLQGRKLNETDAKGIIIRDGRKVMGM